MPSNTSAGRVTRSPGRNFSRGTRHISATPRHFAERRDARRATRAWELFTVSDTRGRDQNMIPEQSLRFSAEQALHRGPVRRKSVKALAAVSILPALAIPLAGQTPAAQTPAA